ncbi:MAG: phosphatase PAP2 family protein [Candidatus Nanohaloarchaea archaeon]
MREYILAKDRQLLDRISGFHPPFLENMLESYTALGSFYLAALFLLVSWFSGRRGFTARMVEGLAVTWAAVYALKLVFRRERPSESHNSFVDYSFPSGHSTTAFFLAVAFSHLLPALSPLFYILAALVAVSRVYLELHYPTDALTGSVIGAAAALILL